jgi:ribonucleoside-diphosphate reductase alpha chain
MQKRYLHPGETTWREVANRVASNVLGAVDAPRGMVGEVANLIAERKFMPGGRYLYAAGRDFHQVQNCLLLRAEDSREGWAEHVSKSTMALMTGAGIGAVYSDLREKGAHIRKTGGTSSGPLALMQMTNEVGRLSGLVFTGTTQTQWSSRRLRTGRMKSRS